MKATKKSQTLSELLFDYKIQAGSIVKVNNKDLFVINFIAKHKVDTFESTEVFVCSLLNNKSKYNIALLNSTIATVVMF